MQFSPVSVSDEDGFVGMGIHPNLLAQTNIQKGLENSSD
jgi:hypothetical protein